MDSKRQQRPPHLKKEGRIVYRVKKGKLGYKDDGQSDSEMDKSTAGILTQEPDKSDNSDGIETFSLRVKERWYRDIHHAKEIASLLKEREKYFGGQLHETCYQTDSNGVPLYFPSSKRFPLRKKGESCATSQCATAPTPREDTPRVQTANSSGYQVASDDEEDQVISVGVESEPESFRPWNKKSDTEETYQSVQKWITSSLENVMETEAEDKPTPLSSSTFKSGVSTDQGVKKRVDLSRVHRSTVSSALKSTGKHDPYNFLGNKSYVWQSEMSRYEIPKAQEVVVSRASLQGARTLLHQAEQALRTSEKQEMLRYRGTRLGYKRETKQPTLPKSEMTASEREANIAKILEKPLPPSKMDFSHGDGVLQKTFSLINIDPMPLLDLKPKGGGKKGVIVPRMENLRQKAKNFAVANRSSFDLTNLVIPQGFNPYRNINQY